MREAALSARAKPPDAQSSGPWPGELRERDGGRTDDDQADDQRDHDLN